MTCSQSPPYNRWKASQTCLRAPQPRKGVAPEKQGRTVGPCGGACPGVAGVSGVSGVWVDALAPGIELLFFWRGYAGVCTGIGQSVD